MRIADSALRAFNWSVVFLLAVIFDTSGGLVFLSGALALAWVVFAMLNHTPLNNG